jgi:hypothetical protein
MRVATILQTTPQAHEMTKQEHCVTAITTSFKIIWRDQLEYKRSKNRLTFL